MSTDNQESTDITGNTDRQGNEPPPKKKDEKRTWRKQRPCRD